MLPEDEREREKREREKKKREKESERGFHFTQRGCKSDSGHRLRDSARARLRVLACSPQKYIIPLTSRSVRTTARSTCRHAMRLESMSSVVAKMHAKARKMFL